MIERIKLLKKIILQAGAILEKKFYKKITYKRKNSPVSIITPADKQIERFLTKNITKKFSLDNILTEESSPVDKKGEYTWIIDPLDGTTNFSHNIPHFCISIALKRFDEIIYGAVFDPIKNELFYAQKNKGTYLNSKRIFVSKRKRLIDSILATGFPYDRQKKASYYLKFYEELMKVTLGIRRIGSASLDLCYVAAGRFDGFWEFKLHPWDIAAGVIIVGEAGGSVTDFFGNNKKYLDGQQVLASNGLIHKELLKKIQQVL